MPILLFQVQGCWSSSETLALQTSKWPSQSRFTVPTGACGGRITSCQTPLMYHRHSLGWGEYISDISTCTLWNANDNQWNALDIGEPPSVNRAVHQVPPVGVSISRTYRLVPFGMLITFSGTPCTSRSLCWSIEQFNKSLMWGWVYLGSMDLYPLAC